jgi:hypothetical protein
MEYLEKQREELLQQVGITMAKLKYCSKLSFYHTLPGEERLGKHFEELDKMWSVAHEIVIFQVEMHFTSMCVKYLWYLLERRL